MKVRDLSHVHRLGHSPISGAVFRREPLLPSQVSM